MFNLYFVFLSVLGLETTPGSSSSNIRFTNEASAKNNEIPATFKGKTS